MGNMDASNAGMSEMGEMALPTPSMGELLYPGFNSIVPQFVEHVLPSVGSLSMKESSILVRSFYELIEFAFRTQIFEKQVPAILSNTMNGASS